MRRRGGQPAPSTTARPSHSSSRCSKDLSSSIPPLEEFFGPGTTQAVKLGQPPRIFWPPTTPIRETSASFQFESFSDVRVCLFVHWWVVVLLHFFGFRFCVSHIFSQARRWRNIPSCLCSEEENNRKTLAVEVVAQAAGQQQEQNKHGYLQFQTLYTHPSGRRRLRVTTSVYSNSK